MQYLRRLVWFLAQKLIIICVLAGILVCGFFMCMNTANIYIILNEGMEKRVEVILTRQDAEELNKCFHYNFLNSDPAIAGAFDGSSLYDSYPITGFDYHLDIEKLWAWPWDNYATCTVVERVTGITGKVLSSRAGAVSQSIPKWTGGRYDITLVRENGLWKIIGMQQRAELMDISENGSDALEPIEG